MKLERFDEIKQAVWVNKQIINELDDLKAIVKNRLRPHGGNAIKHAYDIGDYIEKIKRREELKLEDLLDKINED